jgi:hypothetical protein
MGLQKAKKLEGVRGDRGIWQGVSIDSLKFYPGPQCLTFLRLVARPQGGQPAAIFHPLGHPTPFAYGKGRKRDGLREGRKEDLVDQFGRGRRG